MESINPRISGRRNLTINTYFVLKLWSMELNWMSYYTVSSWSGLFTVASVPITIRPCQLAMSPFRRNWTVLSYRVKLLQFRHISHYQLIEIDIKFIHYCDRCTFSIVYFITLVDQSSFSLSRLFFDVASP